MQQNALISVNTLKINFKDYIYSLQTFGKYAWIYDLTGINNIRKNIVNILTSDYLVLNIKLSCLI